MTQREAAEPRARGRLLKRCDATSQRSILSRARRPPPARHVDDARTRRARDDRVDASTLRRASRRRLPLGRRVVPLVSSNSARFCLPSSDPRTSRVVRRRRRPLTSPPLSEAAQRSLADVEAAVARAAADPVALASPSAPNQYLPRFLRILVAPPPEPVRFPRAPLNIKLAVMLLRSTYETVDAMNIMPMDQFQIKFWKARQAEWEPYKFQYAPLVIEQGKLSDPLYFDFISYVQCGSRRPRDTQQRAGVRRTLGGRGHHHGRPTRRRVVGQQNTRSRCWRSASAYAVYARCVSGLRGGDVSGIPEPSDPTAPDALERVVRGMDAIVNAMVAKGYALKGAAAKVEGDDARVRVYVSGPANLWGAQALAARGVSPPNEYLGYALTGFCRASRVRSAYTARTTDTGTELEFTLAA